MKTDDIIDWYINKKKTLAQIRRIINVRRRIAAMEYRNERDTQERKIGDKIWILHLNGIYLTKVLRIENDQYFVAIPNGMEPSEQKCLIL